MEIHCFLSNIKINKCYVKIIDDIFTHLVNIGDIFYTF